ncbi:MAG: hypothetical protein ACXWHG_12410 [Thermoanaerobaculia bacterium]
MPWRAFYLLKIGDNAIWLMSGSTIAASSSVTPVSDPNWEIVPRPVAQMPSAPGEVRGGHVGVAGGASARYGTVCMRDTARCV